jgi:hypothetical protein
MKTELNNSTQTNKPSNPTPTLTLPLKGREIAMFLPLQGGGQEGDGVFVGVVLNLPYRKINGTHKISASAGLLAMTVTSRFYLDCHCEQSNAISYFGHCCFF